MSTCICRPAWIMGCIFALLGLACMGRDPKAFQAIRPMNHWGKTLCEIDSGIWVEYVSCILCGKFAHACSINTYTYSIASLPGPWLAFHHLRYGTTFVQNVWNEAIFMYFTTRYVCNHSRRWQILWQWILSGLSFGALHQHICHPARWTLMFLWMMCFRSALYPG